VRGKATSAARAGLLVLLAVAAWRATNPIDYEPGPDSSFFMSIAWHANHGRVLYKNTIGGAPLIYALNGTALAIGDDGVNSVRAMERIFAVAGIAAFFVATYLAFGRFWLACLTGMLFLLHLYQPHVFEDGNVTEEYGTVLALAGMAGVIASLKSPGRRTLILAGLAGMAFSLSILCKEPFLLIAPPWFVYLAWPRNGKRREALLRVGAFLVGAATPAVAFLGYLIAHGAWASWIDTIATGFAYTAAGPTADANPFLTRLLQGMNAKVQPLLVARITAAMGLVGLLNWSFVRRRDGLPLVIAASAVLSLLATSIGGRYYGHYYLFFVPSFALLCASGIAFVADLVSSSRRWSGVALAGLLLLLLLLLLLVPDAAAIKLFATSLAVPARRWEGHWLSEVIRKNTSPDDLIWAPWKPLLYAESHRLSPTKWQSVYEILFADTWRNTAAEKFKTLRADIEARPPRVIVVSAIPGSGPTRAPAEAFLVRSGLKAWIAANYESAMCSDEAQFDLLLWKGALAGPALTPRTSDSVAMDVGLTALYRANEPSHAVDCFRMVLAKNPAHYGASFQLAKSLDAAGRSADAAGQWKLMLRLAREARDTATEAVVLARLR
jgi:hypothetical protein